MWRIAQPNQQGEFEGGHLAWRDLANSDWDLNSMQFHAKARTPFIFDALKRRFLGYENVQSITEKARKVIFFIYSLFLGPLRKLEKLGRCYDLGEL
jgi:hypothetical protein